MKKIIMASLMAAFLNAGAQNTDTTRQFKKLPSYILTGGKYNVTIDNGKMTFVKNPHFDQSKFNKREMPRGNFSQRIEIFVYGSDIPIIKHHFIYDLKSESSVVSLTKQERIAKYGSREPAEMIYLKPGVIPLTISQLYSKFNVAKENVDLPLYLDYRPIAKPIELMGVPDAIYKIEIVKDPDGVRFLNIITKSWKDDHDKNPDVLYIR